MNNQELRVKVRTAIYHEIRKKGYVSSVDVLMDLGYLTKRTMMTGALEECLTWSASARRISISFH